MKIFMVDNQNGGFADFVDTQDSITVEKFLEDRGINPASFLVRINRQTVAMSYTLQEGDRISVTPTKIAGASI